ncbi:hypothetical protein IG558_17785, partial [Vibrio cholerae]
MELRDIKLGNLDAKNELLSDTEEERNNFKNSFVIPPNLDVQKYETGEKYFILGLKGTGKTALLRYLSICTEEKYDSKSCFILFKSDIDEDFRKDFTRSARSTITDNNSDTSNHDDYEYVWRWFIYRKLVSMIEEDNIDVFQRNSAYNEFKAIIRSPSNPSEDERGILNLLPKIRKGNITISQSPEISFELDWSNGEANVNFNVLVRKADQKFEQLLSGDGIVNIYFDELELNNNTNKQYERDAKIIRDAIVTISKINSISKRKGFNLRLYSAIRSEIQNSVDSLGKEINKLLGDFGTEIMWHRPGIDVSSQPLLNIITKRLRTNEVVIDSDMSDNDLWTMFFPDKIQN